jgi:hypothetical protein
VISRNVEFIDAAAFCNVNFSSCMIESGNERFVLHQDFLIDIFDHKFIHNFSTLPDFTIPFDIEIVGSSSFNSCESV